MKILLQFCGHLVFLALVAFCIVPYAGAQTIVNGGFESGLANWTPSANFYSRNNTNRSHRGSQYAYFGVAADGITALANASGTNYQSVSIPAEASSALLTYWVWIASDEGTNTGFDFLYVDVLNNSGGFLSTVSTNSNRDKSGSFNSTNRAYLQRSIPLSAYAGSTIRIRFRGSVDSSSDTLFRLDDVNVTAVTVTSPNGGENWSADTTKTITWTIFGNENNIRYFKIALSTDGGTTWPEPGMANDLTPDGRPSTDRSFDWAIPGSLDTTTARIRVRPIDVDTYILSQDTNDANFTIAALSPDLISVTGIPSTSPVGQPFTVTVLAENDAGTGGQYSAINASILYSDGTDDVTITDATAGWGDNQSPYNFPPGRLIRDNMCNQIVAVDHLVEAQDNNWASGEQHSLSFTVTPNKTGTLYVRARVTLHNGDGGCDYRNDVTALGGSPSTDQQGWGVTQYSVNVSSCAYFLGYYSANHPSGFSLGGFNVRADSGCSWTATTTDGWIHTSSSGSGHGYVNYTVDPNLSVSPRSGIITVGGQMFTINQSGASPPPVAMLDGDSSAGYGQLASFSGARSTGTGTLSYTWDFGDGSSANTPTPTHQYYPLNGNTTYTVTLTVTDNNGSSSRTLRVTVSGQSLGTSPQTSKSSDPVNLANGNYIYEHTDVKYQSRGFPFEFRRFYNSRDTLSTGIPLGFGWTHNYNIKLADNTTNLVLTFGDGHQEIYLPTNNYYKGESGVFSIVTNVKGLFVLQTKDLLRYTFDSNRRLASIVDKNNNALTLHYDHGGSGLLEFIRDTANRTNRLEYNSTNCLVRIIDPLGRTNFFDYDSQTNLIAAIDANGGITCYKYLVASNHQMTAAFDPRNNKFVSNVYDELRRVVTTQKDALDFETTFFYDFTNRITTVSNSFGFSRHFHDDKLRVTNIINTLDQTNAFAYDENNNRTEIIDRRGYRTTYTYDDRGNVTSTTDALTNRTFIVYDALNNPIYRTNALNLTTSFGYDVKGNLTFTTNELKAVSSVIYDGFGQPFVLTDANDYSTTNTFDAYGNLTVIVNALGYTNQLIYDIVGRQLTRIDANNHTNSLLYDNNDNILFAVNALNQTNAFLYDSNNNLTVSLDPRGNGVTNRYDEKDRLTVVQNAYGAVTNEYDNLDRKIGIRDARGGRIRMGYDSEGHLLFLTNAMNEVTAFIYDPNGNQTSVKNNLGQITTNLFDPLNRLVTSVAPLNRTNLFIFDVLGRQVQTIDANGRTNAFGFDSASRLHTVTNALGTTEEAVSSFDYDNVGNRTLSVDPLGNTTTNIFNELNQLFLLQEPRGVNQFGYDGVGNKIIQVDGNQTTNSYCFDAANRLFQIHYPTGNVTFAYDEAGNRTNMLDGLGTSSWQYDKLNRLTNSTDCYGKSVGYVLDVNGNRTALMYPGSKMVSYMFDLNNRMISVSNWLGEVTSYNYNGVGNLFVVTNGNGSTTFYGYDEASRLNALTNLTPADAVISSYSLSLDAVGNTRSSVQTEPLTALLRNQMVAYAYTNANTLIAAGTETYLHDRNGNLTNKSNSSLVYDFENRLTRLETLSLTNLCSYDGLGHRMMFASNSLIRHFVLDVSASLTQMLAETDSLGNITAYYIYGLGLISKVAASGDRWFYHFDQGGNTVALTGTNGVMTDKYAYDPFGAVLNKEGTTANIFLFLGQYGIVDDGNGLSYIRARHYLASVGCFITKDPLTGRDSDSQSVNRYAYALNNPIRFFDITGFNSHDRYSLPSDYDTLNDEVRPPGFFGEIFFDTAIGLLAIPVIAVGEYIGSAFAVETTAQVVINRVTGLAAERVVQSQLISEGNIILGSQVTVRTALGRRVLDFLIQTPQGVIQAVEVKAGGAIRTSLQVAKDYLLSTEGGTIIGKNAPELLRGVNHIFDTIVKTIK